MTTTLLDLAVDAAGKLDVLTDDDSMVAALQVREAAAYEAIVRRFGDRMLTVARRFLSCEQDCADAVQEAFVSAFQAIDRFKGDSQFGTWLHRILVNACLMKLRTKSRRQEVSLEGGEHLASQRGKPTQGGSRWHQPPDVQLQRDETRALVRRCIDLLPDDYRDVLLLRDIEELNTDEAAARLCTTPAAVKTRLHRARQALRSLLNPELADRPGERTVPVPSSKYCKSI